MVTPLAWMVGASVGTWLVLTLSAGDVNPEALFGMLGPRATAVPERVTGVMVTGLVVKMVFFGAYVAGMLKGAELRPVPFVVSFAGFFIALHAMEAVFLRRLFADMARSSSSE